MSNRPARRTPAARNLPQVGHAVHVKSSRSGNANANGSGGTRRQDPSGGASANENSVSHVNEQSMSLSGSTSASDIAVESVRLLLTELVRLQTAKVGENHAPSRAMVLQPAQPAPDFKGTAVVDGEFKEISLRDYRGKYVVLFFYPLDFTFVCPTEIVAFSDRSDEFRKLGCEIIACSTDSHFSHLAWVNTPRKMGGLGEMKIPLLADKTCEIARSYGVLKEDEGVAFRGLFIIDGKGTLRQITINDMPVGRSIDEILRLLQAFQFTDKHGEVCPAGWKPGSKTMKPGVKESKDYFQTQL